MSCFFTVGLVVDNSSLGVKTAAPAAGTDFSKWAHNPSCDTCGVVVPFLSQVETETEEKQKTHID